MLGTILNIRSKELASVVQRLDSAINLVSPLNTYLLDSDLSSG